MVGKYVEVIRKLVTTYGKQANFSAFVGKCHVVEAHHNRVKVEFKVTEDLTNGWQTLHGGCTATLVDMVTTTALFTHDKAEEQHPGVSVDMALSYYAPAKLGETVVVDAQVIRRGRTLAFTKANLFRKEDKTPIAFGTHTKAFPPVKLDKNGL